MATLGILYSIASNIVLQAMPLKLRQQKYPFIQYFKLK